MTSSFSDVLINGYFYQQTGLETSFVQHPSKCLQNQVPDIALQGDQQVRSAHDKQRPQGSQAVVTNSCNSSLHFIAEPALVMQSPERPDDLHTGFTTFLSSQLFIFSEPDPPRTA